MSSVRQKIIIVLSTYFLFFGALKGVSQEAERMPEIVVSSTVSESESPKGEGIPALSLSRKELSQKQGRTLGEALGQEPGIAQSNFGAAANRPVVRGLGGDRVRVLENGTGTQDVSTTSPDHAVTVEPFLAEKIEVLRGPAALRYGNTAVGGVVNVDNGRIPDLIPNAPFDAQGEFQLGSNDNERSGAVKFNIPVGSFVFHLDTSARKTSDYRIPGFARTSALRENQPLEYPEPRGKVPFSATETHEEAVGGSYIGEKGYIGAVFSDYHTLYGVPNGEEDVSIDGNRQRIEVRGKAYEPLQGIEDISFNLGTVDYHHTEFEGEEAGTRFNNKGFEGRIDARHKSWGPLKGVVGIQAQEGDFSAIGEETFQPPTTTQTQALFLYEELQVGESLTFQFGSRAENQQVRTSGTEGVDDSSSINSLTSSHSIATVWKFQRGYSTLLSLAHTERAPNGQELFADGPHVATGAYEIGDRSLKTERSTGLDVSLRKEEGSITGFIGAYANRINNFINLTPTGNERDDLNEYRFVNQQAMFYGMESRVAYAVMKEEAQNLSVYLQPDYVWAEERRSATPLPRIPPFRVRVGASYEREGSWGGNVEIFSVLRQGRNALFETETDGYTLVGFFLHKPMKISKSTLDFFFKGNNLTNEKAREHTSFIKDVAPLPGASLIAGLSFKF